MHTHDTYQLAIDYQMRKSDLNVRRQGKTVTCDDDETKICSFGEAAYPVSQIEKALLASDACSMDYTGLKNCLVEREKLYSFMHSGLFISQTQKLVMSQVVIQSLCERTDELGETVRTIAQQAIGDDQKLETVYKRDFHPASFWKAIENSQMIQYGSEATPSATGLESFLYSTPLMMSDDKNKDAQKAYDNNAGAQYFSVLGF